MRTPRRITNTWRAGKHMSIITDSFGKGGMRTAFRQRKRLRGWNVEKSALGNWHAKRFGREKSRFILQVWLRKADRSREWSHWRQSILYWKMQQILSCKQNNSFTDWLVIKFKRWYLKEDFLKACKETRSFKDVMNCLFFCPYGTRIRTYVL